MSHVFTFELWPPDATQRTLPARTRRIVTEDPRGARVIAESEASAGWMIGAGQHHRADCTPPHPGIS